MGEKESIIIGCTYHLRNSDAEEVKVADTRELEEELLGQEIPQRVARSANAVGDVRMSAPNINQWLVILQSQRNLPAILGGGQLAPLQDLLDNGLLVHRSGNIVDALDDRGLGDGSHSFDAALLRVFGKSAGLLRLGAHQTIGAAHAGHHDGAMCIKLTIVTTPGNLLFFLPKITISERQATPL